MTLNLLLSQKPSKSRAITYGKIADIEIEVTLDTGADDSIIDNTSLEALGLTLLKPENPVLINGVTGSIMNLGTTEFDLTIHNKTRRIKCLVISNTLSRDLILSLGDLHKFSITLQAIENKPLKATILNDNSEEWDDLYLLSDHDDLKTKEKTVLYARSETVVHLANLPSKEGFLSNKLDGPLRVAEGPISTSNSWVYVVNDSDNEVEIPAGNNHRTPCCPR